MSTFFELLKESLEKYQLSMFITGKINYKYWPDHIGYILEIEGKSIYIVICPATYTSYTESLTYHFANDKISEVKDKPGFIIQKDNLPYIAFAYNLDDAKNIQKYKTNRHDTPYTIDYVLYKLIGRYNERWEIKIPYPLGNDYGINISLRAIVPPNKLVIPLVRDQKLNVPKKDIDDTVAQLKMQLSSILPSFNA